MIGICAPIAFMPQLLDLGFDFLEVRCDEIRELDHSEKHIFCANSFIPGHLPLFADLKVFDRALQYSCTLLSICKEKSIRHITFGSGLARSIPPGVGHSLVFERWKKLLSAIDFEAGENNVTIGLEPLNTQETNFINTFAEAKDWIYQLNLKNIGITFDSFHLCSANQNCFEQIDDLGLKLITHVHISDSNQQFLDCPDCLDPKVQELISRQLFDRHISIEPVPFNFDSVSSEAVVTLKKWSSRFGH